MIDHARRIPEPSKDISGHLDLDRVTIVSVNGRDPEASVAAIRHSCRNLRFAKRLLITNRPLPCSDIDVIEIQGLNTIQEYNRYVLKDLYVRIETDYCLIVQPDGFVVTPRLWSEFYLHYDYIGAPWNYLRSREVLMKSGHSQESLPAPIVGNGGFSLRSRKLMQAACSLCDHPDLMEEDCFIAVKARRELESRGLRFAPVRLAQQFSLDAHIDQHSVVGNHFGFHGRFPYFEEYLRITRPSDS